MAAEEVRGPAYRVVTPRAVIRCWNPADAALIKDAVDVSIDHLRPWMPWAAHHPQPLQDSIELLRRFRGQFDLGQDYTYGIFTPDETMVLGGTGLHPRGGEGAREIGYWIRADQVNRGYATEVAAALTRVGFEIEKLRRIGIHCVVENVRSAAVPPKLGYIHEATLRRRIRHEDGFHDEMVWTMLAEEYPEAQPTPSTKPTTQVQNQHDESLRPKNRSFTKQPESLSEPSIVSLVLGGFRPPVIREDNLVRTRFAPSPTGYMHIGNLRAALYAYLTARHYGGVLVLRIEDTDRRRNVEDAVQVIYDSLRLAGLDYDEGPDKGGDYGPYVQSQRRPIYKEHAERLVELGAAYRCFCGKADAEPSREAVEEGDEAVETAAGDGAPAEGPAKSYDPCRFLPPEEANRRAAAGEPHVIRQRIPETGVTTFHDHVYGTITWRNDLLDDQVLLKSDGYPTYNFANVVDDHLMAITHVMRGVEYLSSTPKYNLLYESFGWPVPEYVHMPHIVKEDGKKLSKRSGDASFQDLVARGYLPEAIVNYIALLGWHPADDREFFTLPELVKAFDIDRINKSSAGFSIAKLDWLNGEHIRALARRAVPRAGAALLPARAGGHGHPDHQPADPAPRRAADRHPGDGGVLRPARGTRREPVREREVEVDARQQPPHPGERAGAVRRRARLDARGARPDARGVGQGQRVQDRDGDVAGPHRAVGPRVDAGRRDRDRAGAGESGDAAAAAGRARDAGAVSDATGSERAPSS